MQYLIHPLGTRQIAQTHRTEITQRYRLRKPAGYPVGNGLRQNDLAAVSGSHDACGAVDGSAEVIIVAALDYPNVHPAAHFQGNAVRGSGIGQRLLQLQGGSHGVESVIEYRVDTVANHFHDCASVTFNYYSDQRIVACQSRPHPFGLMLPEPGAPLDVGEEKGCVCGWVVHGNDTKTTRTRLPCYGSG